MNNSIVDLCFGIDSQAMSVLHLLNNEPNFARYDNRVYEVRCVTRPWYNGRECGFVLSVTPPKGHTLHIAVFEHRNSDEICALKWETEHDYRNHPLEDPDVFETAYHSGNSWGVAHRVPYGRSGEMASWVYGEFEAYYNACMDIE